MNIAVTALIRSALADLEPRIITAESAVLQAQAVLQSETRTLTELTSERDQLLAGLPDDIEPTDAPEQTDDPETEPTEG